MKTKFARVFSKLPRVTEKSQLLLNPRSGTIQLSVNQPQSQQLAFRASRLSRDTFCVSRLQNAYPLSSCTETYLQVSCFRHTNSSPPALWQPVATAGLLKMCIRHHQPLCSSEAMAASGSRGDCSRTRRRPSVGSPPPGWSLTARPSPEHTKTEAFSAAHRQATNMRKECEL